MEKKIIYDDVEFSDGRVVIIKYLNYKLIKPLIG